MFVINYSGKFTTGGNIWDPAQRVSQSLVSCETVCVWNLIRLHLVVSGLDELVSQSSVNLRPDLNILWESSFEGKCSG